MSEETSDEVDKQKVCSTEFRGLVLKIISRKLSKSTIESLSKIKGCLKSATNEDNFHMKALKTDLAILFLDRLRNLSKERVNETIF